MRRAVATAAGAAVLAGATVAVATGGDEPSRAAPATDTATARVERGTLRDREAITGTLGYAGARELLARAAGTVTRPPREAAVVRRGASLYALDGERTAFVLYGRLPAWRDLAPGIEGPDVRQLERNLRALGHDPGTVDEDWTSATTAAVNAFQEDRGLDEDGTLSRDEVLFTRGPVRVGDVEAEAGTEVQPGAPVATLSGTRRQVTVDLEADRQQVAREGGKVTVTLPDGRDARGVITHVAAVAETPKEEGAEATVEVRIRLRGKAARGTRLDQAPVEVGFVRERARDVLHVPVTALLAVSGRGYAVEVVRDGRHVRVPVELGLISDSRAEVSGDLRAGERVVVPA